MVRSFSVDFDQWAFVIDQLETGQTQMLEVAKVNARSLIALLKALEAAHPQKRRIHVHLDNASGATLTKAAGRHWHTNASTQELRSFLAESSVCVAPLEEGLVDEPLFWHFFRSNHHERTREIGEDPSANSA